MSVTESGRFNPADLTTALQALAAGSTWEASGVRPDLAGDKTVTAAGATDAQLTQALATAVGEFVDPATTWQQAVTGLQTLLGQHSTLSTQLQADIATVTNAGGWHSVAQADQDAIIGRILNGFGTVMQAIADHLTVTGVAQ